MSRRFVKLYVDDTPTTAMWSWDARSLFPHLLRKSYPTGAIAHKGRPLPNCVAALTGAPVDVCERALPELEADDTIQITDTELVIPNLRGWHFGSTLANGEDALLEFLADGPQPATEAIGVLMDEAGVGERQAKEIKKALGIESVRIGKVWHWRVRETAPRVQGCSPRVQGCNSASDLISVSSTSNLDLNVEEQLNDPSRESAARAHYTDAERVKEAVAYLTPPAGLPGLTCAPDRVAKVLATGVTPDEAIAVVTALRDAVDAGTRPADQWRGTYVFSGWFDTLRLELLGTRQDF